MVQAVERLELPSATYRVLEQIAQRHGTTPAGAVEKLIQQFQFKENLIALRHEYQQLADKELSRTITSEEEARLEEVCDQINFIEMQSETNRIWQEQAEGMQTLLQELKSTLQALPDVSRVQRKQSGYLADTRTRSGRILLVRPMRRVGRSRPTLANRS